MSDTGKAAANAAQNSTIFRTLARIGYVVLGILHIVIGILAISVSTGTASEDADQGGAIQQIAEAPAGILLLWIIVLGLFALAIWQIAEAFLERNPDTKKKWGYRLKYIGTAVAYIGSRSPPSSMRWAAGPTPRSRRRRSARS